MARRVILAKGRGNRQLDKQNRCAARTNIFRVGRQWMEIPISPDAVIGNLFKVGVHVCTVDQSDSRDQGGYTLKPDKF